MSKHAFVSAIGTENMFHAWQRTHAHTQRVLQCSCMQKGRRKISYCMLGQFSNQFWLHFQDGVADESVS
jgi:hypothetical protein